MSIRGDFLHRIQVRRFERPQVSSERGDRLARESSVEAPLDAFVDSYPDVKDHAAWYQLSRKIWDGATSNPGDALERALRALPHAPPGEYGTLSRMDRVASHLLAVHARSDPKTHALEKATAQRYAAFFALKNLEDAERRASQGFPSNWPGFPNTRWTTPFDGEISKLRKTARAELWKTDLPKLARKLSTTSPHAVMRDLDIYFDVSNESPLTKWREKLQNHLNTFVAERDLRDVVPHRDAPRSGTAWRADAQPGYQDFT